MLRRWLVVRWLPAAALENDVVRTNTGEEGLAWPGVGDTDVRCLDELDMLVGVRCREATVVPLELG